MSATLFFLTRLVTLVILLQSFIFAISENSVSLRDVSFWFITLAVLWVSFLYEKKRKLFLIGYVYYYIVIFLSNIWAPYRYINDSYIQSLNEVKPNDHYWIFFAISAGATVLILIYLLSISKNRSIGKFKITTNKAQLSRMFYSMLLIIPIWLASSSEVIRFVLVFFTSYFIVVFLQYPSWRRQKMLIAGVCISVFVILQVAGMRFVFVKYALPLVFYFILRCSFLYENKIRLKYLGVFFAGVAVVLIYGVISEISKLSALKGNLDVLSQLVTAFASIDTLGYWIDRQLYRVISIWTILGGNIIDYVHMYGYMFGLTYIKALSVFFGFEYISLPLIAADIIGASYAQPGIVAEGYANFGIIGGILNTASIFFIMEYFWDNFRKNNNVFFFLVYITCFSQSIMDGGSINSVMFLFLLGYFSFHVLDLFKLIKYGKNTSGFIHLR